MAAQSVRLTWPTAGGTFPVTYHIYRSVNGGSFSLLTSVTDVLTYTDSSPVPADYRYYVVADNGNGDLTSPSNTVLETVPGAHFSITAGNLNGGGGSNYRGYDDGTVGGSPFGSITGTPLTGYTLPQVINVTAAYTFGASPDATLARQILFRFVGASSSPTAFFSAITFVDHLGVTRTLNYADATVNTLSGNATEIYWTISPHAVVFVASETYDFTVIP